MSKVDEGSAARRAGRAVLMGPETDKEFMPLGSFEIRRRVLLARLTAALRDDVQRYIGMPAGRILLKRWLSGKRGARFIERHGLPRHNLEEYLGAPALTLHIDPRTLIRNVAFLPRKVEKRPSSMAFIWDGHWDLRRDDLRLGSRYRFISDIDEHRDQLERTERFQELAACIEQGRPWSSHQKGILLDTPEKIKSYLRVYIGYLDDMAAKGYVADVTRDDLGVAISREGRILKINRGLHRLAMAQRLGLPRVPVRVRAVHRIWWDQITEGASGQLALERLCQALGQCVAEQKAGTLDSAPSDFPSEGFWPLPRRAD
ncbi:hypothetical protein RE432_02940 [Pusillimonas sp. SM2304]|uniref:hypothetical protein n=1 Tax=Pusillimonas sp. SM2304 TaxID=3073241 RepID=UPI0028767569|nr:hypothetical protein [Pusillimonas sp. SM2304]MDS1139377.1 hypothetical protein [Pusillimonas sp. SM2304]